MEYERTEDGQIQAAFASRIGQILLQYEQFCVGLPESQRFEATLAVSLLQTMLTSSLEALEARRSKALNAGAGRSLLDDPAQFGLNPGCILQSWSSARALTYWDVFKCLRNALSHPGTQGNSRYERTGFTSDQSGSASVTAYVFTQSPWVNSKGSALTPTYAPKGRDIDSKRQLEEHARNWGDKNAVKDLVVLKDAAGFWRVHRDDEPFVPVLQLRLGVVQLRTLTLVLSDLLSEAVNVKAGAPA